MQRDNGQNLLEAKINLLLKKLHVWGVTTHHDQSNWEFMVRSPCEVTFHRTPLFLSTIFNICLFSEQSVKEKEFPVFPP